MQQYPYQQQRYQAQQQPYQTPRVEQTVKIYKRRLGPSFLGGGSPAQQFQRDAPKMARHGWRVVSQSEFGRHVRSLTVTYQRYV